MKYKTINFDKSLPKYSQGSLNVEIPDLIFFSKGFEPKLTIDNPPINVITNGAVHKRRHQFLIPSHLRHQLSENAYPLCCAILHQKSLKLDSDNVIELILRPLYFEKCDIPYPLLIPL